MKALTPHRAAVPALLLAFSLSAALLVSPAASGQDGRRVAQDLDRVMESYDRLRLDPSEVLRGARERGRVTLATSRGTFDLAVEPFDIRADNYRAVAAGEGGRLTELPRGPSHAWRGEVRGAQSSSVRLVLDGRKLQGVIVTPDETFYVEGARNLSASAGPQEFVFYAASSVKSHGGGCGVTLAERVEAQAARLTPEEVFTPKPEAQVATEADYEYFQASGASASAANQDILDVMTQVDAVYDFQLGIKLRVVNQRVWVIEGDPYTQTGAQAALDELAAKFDRTYRDADQTPPARDLVHMFTGKTLDGGVIGIANQATVCSPPSSSYGISRSRYTAAASLRVKLTAHGIGHNFGATHPDEESSPPPSCDPSIMNSAAQDTTNFCQFSRDQITSHVAGAGGSCLSRLTPPGCQYELSTSNKFFTAQGGTGVVGVSATQGCEWGVAEGADWVDVTAGLFGHGPGSVTLSVPPNPDGGPRHARLEIGGRKLDVTQAASHACSSTPLDFNQPVSGSLSPSDCRSGKPGRAGAYADLYTFKGWAGQRVGVSMRAAVRPSGATPPPEALDTFLYLFAPDGTLFMSVDNRHPGDTDADISIDSFMTLPATGIYTIEATSSSDADAGDYTLTLFDHETTSTSSSDPLNPVEEGFFPGDDRPRQPGRRQIIVSALGHAFAPVLSGTATVDYETSDGTAVQGKDYMPARGTAFVSSFIFTATIEIFVIDDAFKEGPETFYLTLSNPVGTSIGGVEGTGTHTTEIVIDSADDEADGPSPVLAESFDPEFFVRQHYLDFLNRNPDWDGFHFWKNDLAKCGTDAACAEVKRINVSAAFFLSIEFQETGYFVYRVHKAAYGDTTSPNVEGAVPGIRYRDFVADTQRVGRNLVVGPPAWQHKLENNKKAFAVEFVLSPRFLAAYPLSMPHAEFVDRLDTNAGKVLSEEEREHLVAELNSSADVAAVRASVLRKVADNATLRRLEMNRAFVLMQYFGYLRRDPDAAPDADYRGWRFWLDKLESFGGNFVRAEMVKAFLNSDEYVERFGLRQ